MTSLIHSALFEHTIIIILFSFSRAINIDGDDNQQSIPPHPYPDWVVLQSALTPIRILSLQNTLQLTGSVSAGHRRHWILQVCASTWADLLSQRVVIGPHSGAIQLNIITLRLSPVDYWTEILTHDDFIVCKIHKACVSGGGWGGGITTLNQGCRQNHSFPQTPTSSIKAGLQF